MNSGPIKHSNTVDITKDQLERCLPKNLRNQATDGLVQKINSLKESSQFRETFRDGVLGYTGVLKGSSFGITQYLEAVKYVSHKLMGDTNKLAFTKTFPNRISSYIANKMSERDIASYVSSYNRGKLVNLIFDQSLVPSHVLNADLYQKAINVQADLMMNASSDKVKQEAANSLLIHLKVPEVAKIEMEINVTQDQAIMDLRATTQELVKQQKAMIIDGSATVVQVAQSKLELVDAEDVAV
jgi:hypothetical protein